MVATLNKKQLLEQLLLAIDLSGWQAIVVSPKKPFRFRLFRNDERGVALRIYIWNCTHGGGAARAHDEYRVQLTSVVPSSSPGEITLLLGWHSGYSVYVAFDILKHDGQASQSPSIQIKEGTLQAAHTKSFAVHERASGEIAVAFRPEFLVDYALGASLLHRAGKATHDFRFLNDLAVLDECSVEHVKDHHRRVVISQIQKKFRENDFRRRVLGAYSNRCAVCGVQLGLVDAAHIIPVASIKSTDETKNGIALCRLHHAAFDRNLISFDERYKVEVSGAESARLTAANLAGGLTKFKQSLKTAIYLPNDARDYPPPQYILEARKTRNWT
jgi:putative restriction endonuclease